MTTTIDISAESSVAAKWDRHATMYEQVYERSTWLWGRDALVLAKLPQTSPDQPQPWILDIVCGADKFAFTVAEMGNEVVATDLSSRMTECVKRKALKYPQLTADVRVVDGRTLKGLSDDSCDTVSSNFSLCLFTQREMAWQSALPELKPGGLIIVTSWGPVSNSFLLTRYV